MPPRTAVATAAPMWVRRHVDGPRRQCSIVHSGQHAVYVAVTDGPARRCVGVLSSRSSFVPCGMRTTWPDLSGLYEDGRPPAPGDHVTIGEQSLQVGSVSFRIGRTVDATVRPFDAASADPMTHRLRSALDGRDAPIRAELSATSLNLLADGDPASVAMLLGRGSGLTPVGDDVLCGWLAVMAAAWPERSCALAHEVTTTAERSTTLLSTTLLDRAVAGDVLPEFRQALRHLHADDPASRALADSVERVLAVGHTSGAGLLLGGLIALDHLISTPPTARKPHP